MTDQVRFCSACGDLRAFITPPCEDGHGFDCPDLACTECGDALTVGLLLRDAAVLVEVRAA